jgi:hypothetical protein
VVWQLSPGQLTPGAALGAAPVPTTLNPSDKDANVTLSNGNLRGTAASVATWAIARATSSKSSGKWYYEATSINAASNLILGLANSTQALASYLGDSVNSVGYYTAAGTIKQNTSILATAAIWSSANDVAEIAVDLTSHLFWARKAGGSWNGTGADPAAGTGGVTILSGTLFPAVSVFDSTGPDAIQINFGATAFTGTVPTGFSAWL